MSVQADAEKFIRQIVARKTVCTLYHGDADGICSAVIMFKLFENMKFTNTISTPLVRGENPFSKKTILKIVQLAPDYLIILDSGSRAGAYPSTIKCLIIDHHMPDEIPDVDVFFNTFLDRSERITSEAVLDVASDLQQDQAYEWYAVAGIVGDAGIQNVPQRFRPLIKKYGTKSIQSSVSLVNAVRRHSDFRVEAVLDLLIESKTPPDFMAAARVAGFFQMQQEVKADLKRVLHTRPRFHGLFALFIIESPHQIHPLIAAIWSAKLKNHVVIAANRGYLEGRVSFSVRSATGIDLLNLLKRYRIDGEEIGFGHRNASGGILETEQFKGFLKRLGF